MVWYRGSFAALSVAALVAGAFAGCGGTTSEATTSGTTMGGGGSGEGGSIGTAGGGGPELPGFDQLEAGKANVILPGGDTVCSRGGEYAFVVIPGAKDKVILEFEGGGACWDAKTCAFASSIFKETVNPKDYESASSQGWYDHARAGHPMKDWTHVYIPYCTGDVHWGDNVKTYGSVTINHKGAVNVRAALDWVYKEIASPEKLFVTGCSAGGYGSIWWAPQVQSHYASAKVYHFSDSAAGVITKDFFDQSFPAWNAQASFPASIGDFKEATTLPALYQMIAAHYPNNVYSQYNTVFDDNQTFYFTAMGGGGGADEWSAQMKASVKSIHEGAPNFRSFIAEGEQHCILPYDNFFTVEAGGKKLTEWLSDMVNDKPIENAACSGCAL